MSFFAAFCNNEEDTTTLSVSSRHRDHDVSAELEKEIIELKRQLREEQERFAELTRSNDASQQRVTELEQSLENSQTVLNTNAVAHEQKQKEHERQHNTSIEWYQAQIDQKQQQLRDLQTKYNDMETQRNEALTKDSSDTALMDQLKTYETQSKSKDETITSLQETVTDFEKYSKQQIAELNETNLTSKDKENKLEQELDQETRRADGIQAQLDDLQKKYSDIETERNELMMKVNDNNDASAALTKQLKTYKTQIKQKDEAIADLEETVIDFEKYSKEKMAEVNEENQTVKDEHNELEEKWVYETQRADTMRDAVDAKTLEITRLESEVDRLSTRVQSLGAEDQYKVVVTDDGDDDVEDIPIDVELKPIPKLPTVTGIAEDVFDAAAYVSKLHNAIDTYRNNPKERIRATVDILVTCTDEQRKQIADTDEKSDVTLSRKFRLYSNNKNVLRVLDLMMKRLSDCDAEWMYKAMDKKSEDVVIEILFSRTNDEIRGLIDAYKGLYDQDVNADIAEAFGGKDEAFVGMCDRLCGLNKRGEISPSEVNKKWANNDGKLLKEYLEDNNDSNKAWDTLIELVVNRSWSHLDEMVKSFNNQTKGSLLFKLKKANPTKSIARRAVLTALQSAHCMHGLYAGYLQQTLKKKAFGGGIDDDALQRILLSRSQIDLADIDHEFTDNVQYGEGKTTRQWIEDSTQSSLYQYILLSLLGLSDIQIKDRSEQEHARHSNSNRNAPVMYRDGLVTYNPCIRAKPSPFIFDEAKDSIELHFIMKETDTKILKEKCAVLLTARDSQQRGAIVAHYPAVIKDIQKKLKKGQVYTLCEAFLKPSIAAYSAFVIEAAINDGDVSKIADVLCTKNNTEIKRIIAEYKKLRFAGADLRQDIHDLCEKTKRGSVSIILSSLLECRRDERMAVDMNAVSEDIDFLINTKKFKAEEKKRLVEIFCNNNWRYIRAINRQYGMRSSDMNLETLIREKLGTGVGYVMALLKYSCDPTQYFVQKLVDLGSRFDKNKEEIGRIFLTRSEIDLNEIRARFANTTHGKQLDGWIEDKTKESKFGFFLKRILMSIDEYNVMMDALKEEQEPEPELVIPVSPDLENVVSDSNMDMDDNDNKAGKPKYEDIQVQNEILNDESKKEQSLKLFKSETSGIIKFLSKYVQSKIVEKMWTKLDSQKKGYIEMTSFPDLMAFVVILYKVKVHQQKTKSKSKPKLDNKAVRCEIEHAAIWIAKMHIYDEENQFKLIQSDFQNNLAQWCQNYIDKNGELL